MSDIPTAGDFGYSDPDTLGAIPPVITKTYCGHCGESASKKNHVLCRQQLEAGPPRYCVTCRRELAVQETPSGWTADCKKHGRTSGEPGRS